MSIEEKSRVGVRWTEQEDIKLDEEVSENKSYEDIAIEHKRTIVGIKLRVIHKIIYPKYKNNININDLATEYKIDKEELEKNINIITNQKEKIKKVKTNDKTLLDNRLLAIEQKLDYIISIININT